MDRDNFNEDEFTFFYDHAEFDPNVIYIPISQCFLHGRMVFIRELDPWLILKPKVVFHYDEQSWSMN